MKNIKPCEYLVAFYDNHGCFDESRYYNFTDIIEWVDYGIRDGDYIKAFAIIKIKDTYFSIELFDSREGS